MKTKRFATEVQAREFAAAVDKAAGCPLPGTNVGRGRHVPPEVSQTVRISDFLFDEKAVEGEKYAYFVDTVVEAFAGADVVVDGKLIEVDLADVKDDYVYEEKKAGVE